MKNTVIAISLICTLFSCVDGQQTKDKKNTPDIKVETDIAEDSYNQLRTDYSLLGRWTIRNTNVSGSWEYEVYYKGSEFIGIKPDGIYKKEILEKSGNKFTVKGNRHGEYYIISANKEMTLFDKDGELASMGYIATKSK